MLESLTQSVQEHFKKAGDGFSAALSKIADLKDTGTDTLKVYLDELSNGLPLIEEAGFKTDSVSVDVGLPPDISISFSKLNEVSAESIQALIEGNKDKHLLVLILKALLAANNMQSKITFNKFIFSGVSVNLGIPPRISLKYS